MGFLLRDRLNFSFVVYIFVLNVGYVVMIFLESLSWDLLIFEYFSKYLFDINKFLIVFEFFSFLKGFLE